MTTRVDARFFVKTITQHATQNPGDVAAEVTLGAAFGSYLKGLPEGDANKDWSKYTPQGEIKITITNPTALEAFAVGEVYAVTFEQLTNLPATAE